MKISTASAQQIVEEIGRLVGQNINLMDHTGHIVASNDPSRIGNFHPGAYELVTRRVKELYITAERERMDPLVRQGINLPIEVDGQIECVIGITGQYYEVIRYGQIVKKMAEILIRERIALETERLDRQVRSRFLEEWVLGEGSTNPQNLAERGFALGIDISIPRRCLVVSPGKTELYTDSLEGQTFLRRVEQVVESQLPGGSIVLRNAGRLILLLPGRIAPDLVRLCRLLVSAVRDRLDVQLACGIDGGASDLHTAYLQANRAWRFANRPTRTIVEYDSLRAELMFDHVSREEKRAFLRKLFPGCAADQIREYILLLDAWFAAEGSLSAIAQTMFIHKNTIQYRLRRLAEITGLDVRKPSQAPALYLAMQVFLELEAAGDGLVI